MPWRAASAVSMSAPSSISGPAAARERLEMCGVAGWYRRGHRPVERSVIAAQCASIVHRGPDDEGILVDGDCGIGMRRLAVVDLAGGRQPMSTADGLFAGNAGGRSPATPCRT